jgi:hypothetical protein
VLEETAPRRNPARVRQALLDACEMTMLRLATDREYFARPERFLFSSIRSLFPIHAQLRVRRTIDRHLAVAVTILEQEAAKVPHACPATTRRGEPCRRVPIGDARYCPSHAHLACEPEAPGLGAATEPQTVAA